jgi:hypothetical protein
LYWATERGSIAPALETAERYYHSALSKAEQLPAGSCREALERQVMTQLRILYQQDGLPLLPWKGWNAGHHDPYLPGVGLTAGFFVSNDPTPSIEDSRMRLFTEEAAFINSDMRLGATPQPMTDLQRWQIVRSPIRTHTALGGTLRENILGRFTFSYRSTHADNAQITSFYVPDSFNDTQRTQIGGTYDRVFPIDPLFDLRLAAQFSRLEATGFVEFLPRHTQNYNVFGFSPSISRTVGPGRLTLAGSYLYSAIPDLPNTSPGFGKRGAWVRGLSLQYAGLENSTFNPFAWGSFAPYRTVSEGFATYLGIIQRDEIEGLDTHTKHDWYGGVHWEGPKPLAIQLEAALFRTAHETYQDDYRTETTNPTRSFTSARLLALPKVRLLHLSRIDPQPLVLGNAQLAEITLVFPLGWEFSLDGPSNYPALDARDHGNDYAHLRVGSELWLRSLSFEPLGGSVMLNAGFDLVHYYELAKTQHLAHAGASLGW